MLTRCSPVFDVILLLCFLPSQSYFISIEAEFEGSETSAGDLTVQQFSQERSINYMYDFFLLMLTLFSTGTAFSLSY